MLIGNGSLKAIEVVAVSAGTGLTGFSRFEEGLRTLEFCFVLFVLRIPLPISNCDAAKAGVWITRDIPNFVTFRHTVRSTA